MVLYSCNCLNVKVISDSSIFQDVNKSSPLGDRAFQVDLRGKGFDIRYSFLLQRQEIQSWSTFTCLNCRKRTHCINRLLNLILLDKDLNCGDEALAKLAELSNYSPIYQIVLFDILGHRGSDDFYMQDFSSVQQHLHKIRDGHDSYIIKVERATEERIRQFENEQREKLELMQKKALQDKRRMISLLCSQPDTMRPVSSVTPASLPSFHAHKMNGTLRKSTGNRDDHVQYRPSAVPPTDVFLSNRAHIMASDNDDLFKFDGLEDEAGTSSGSDSDECCSMSGRLQRTDITSCDNKPYFSASVPVNIALNRQFCVWRGKDERDCGDINLSASHIDPSQIKEQMEMLSDSIPDQSRYIFGDRPRPRLYTNNF